VGKEAVGGLAAAGVEQQRGAEGGGGRGAVVLRFVRQAEL
jgi:hypothetical protein